MGRKRSIIFKAGRCVWKLSILSKAQNHYFVCKKSGLKHWRRKEQKGVLFVCTSLHLLNFKFSREPANRFVKPQDPTNLQRKYQHQANSKSFSKIVFFLCPQLITRLFAKPQDATNLQRKFTKKIPQGNLKSIWAAVWIMYSNFFYQTVLFIPL